jgi:hypothetical protein
MKKLILTAVTSALLVVTAAPAHADSDTFVDRKEFKRVSAGMTLLVVHDVFDIHGIATRQGGGYMDRRYRAWTGHVVKVTYRYYDHAWRLVSKSIHAA